MGRMSNILLTGATGYLGSNLAKSLVANGYSLTILIRSSSSLKRIESILDNVKTYIISEDLNFAEVYKHNMIDVVVNTAASYGRNGETLTEIYTANVLFPIRLLQGALKNNIKCFINTNTTLPPAINNYSLSKNQFSAILKLNHDKLKVVDIALEYFYGPNDDISKFVTFILSKLRDNVSHIDFSSGIQVRDFIYIEDVISAYLLLISKIDLLPGYQSVPLGSGLEITLKDLTQKINNIYGKGQTKLNFGALPMRANEVMYSVADTTYLTNLGWKPEYDIDKGLHKTITIENNTL
jgi:CDP-paratose synthetase